MKSTKELFEHAILDLHSAEKQIIEALPKIIEKTSSPELKKGLEMHLQQTEEQLKRIEQICNEKGFDMRAPKCKGMEGIILENEESLKEASPAIRDLVIASGSRKVEHYEMSGYLVAISLAESLGEIEAAELLEQTLKEEEETDKKLSLISEKELK